jgi:hypothetical protein
VNNLRHVARFIAICTLAATAAISWLPATGASASSSPTARPVSGPAASTAANAAVTSLATQAGAIAGTVDGAAGIPLSRICVAARGQGAIRVARTAADGRYVLTGVRAGTYTLTYSDCASPGGYQSQSAPVTVAAGQPDLLAPVALTPASPEQALGTEQAYARSHPGLASAAARKPALTGIVRSAAGKPLAGICVTAVGNAKTSGTEWVSTTSRTGRYSIPAFAGGKGFAWRVLFTVGCGSTGNYAPQWWKDAANRHLAAVLHQASASSTFSGISARLTRGAAVAGVVRGGSAAGPALSGVCVLASGRGYQAGVDINAVTGAGGRYDLRGLGTGRYIISFSPGCGQQGNYLGRSYGQVTTKTSVTRTGVDGVLPVGGIISGAVTGSQPGNPAVPGICVDAISDWGGISPATTSKAGAYVIRRLSAGSYYLEFSGGCGNAGSYAPQYFSGQAAPGAAGLVDVAAGATRTADAVMLPGGTLTGAVTGPAGAPVADACASPLSQQQLGVETSAGPGLDFIQDGSVETNSAGQYAARNLAPGLYLVSFNSCGAGSDMSGWFTAGDPTPQWLSVNAGASVQASAALQRPGRISGTIRTTSGRALARICVFAVSSNGPALGELAELNYGGGLAGLSSKTGRYSISQVEPGQYTVEFSACLNRAYAPQVYKDKGTGGAPAPVTVRSGRTTGGIDAAVGTGKSVSGLIRSGPTGKPVANACVVAVPGVGSAGSAVTLAEALGGQVARASNSGRFTLHHLGSRTYTLEAGLCYATTLAVIQARLHVPAGRAAAKAITLTLPRPGKVSGTVTAPASAGGGAGTCVIATPVSGDGIEQSAAASRTGSYVLTGLAPGRYQLLFTNACLDGTAQLAPALVSGVTVSAGTTAQASAALALVGSITGTVTAAGSPVAGECAAAFTSATATTPAAVAVTGTNGSYQLGSLAAGNYLVRFAGGCGNTAYSTQWWNDTTAGAVAPGQAVPVPVASGEPSTGINAAVTPAA